MQIDGKEMCKLYSGLQLGELWVLISPTHWTFQLGVCATALPIFLPLLDNLFIHFLFKKKNCPVCLCSPNVLTTFTRLPIFLLLTFSVIFVLVTVYCMKIAINLSNLQIVFDWLFLFNFSSQIKNCVILIYFKHKKYS